MTATDSPALRMAVILVDRGIPGDAVFDRVAARLRAQGLRVGGLVQREGPAPEGCCAAMDLEELDSGRLIRISQDLGPGARGCRLDPRGLAEAAIAAETALARGLDLLVINRFGKGEADGGGLRAVMAAALDAGVPVLTAVRPPYAEACTAFHGGMAAELPADEAAVLAWFAETGS